MASSIMDFLMLALVGGGALFIYINRECIMNNTCFGNTSGCSCPAGQNCKLIDNTCYTPPICTSGKVDDGNGVCVVDTGGTGDNPTKCKSQYNGSCSGECGSGSKCTNS